MTKFRESTLLLVYVSRRKFFDFLLASRTREIATLAIPPIHLTELKYTNFEMESVPTVFLTSPPGIGRWGRKRLDPRENWELEYTHNFPSCWSGTNRRFSIVFSLLPLRSLKWWIVLFSDECFILLNYCS